VRSYPSRLFRPRYWFLLTLTTYSPFIPRVLPVQTLGLHRLRRAHPHSTPGVLSRLIRHGCADTIRLRPSSPTQWQVPLPRSLYPPPLSLCPGPPTHTSNLFSIPLSLPRPRRPSDSVCMALQDYLFPSCSPQFLVTNTLFFRATHVLRTCIWDTAPL
jgi:hypothetical protein